MQFFRKSKFILLCLLFVTLNTFSQQYPSKNYSTLDGLPNNSIYSIFKDSRGILWIGTANGVSALINGKITNFSQNDGLAYNNCWSIVEDRNHHLWFASYGGGITFYDGKKFKIINERTGLVNNYVRKIVAFKNHLYIGTKDGISVLDITSFELNNYKNPLPKGYIPNEKFQIMDFFSINNDVYAAAFNGGFWKINSITKSLKHIKYKYSIFATFVQNGFLYISQGGVNNKSIDRIKLIDFIQHKTPKQYIGQSIIWQFTADKKGKMYGAGFSVHFPKGGVYHFFNGCEIDENKRFSVKSTQGWCIYYDKKNDLIYLGTIDNGLYEISLKNEISYNPFSAVLNENVDLNFITPFNHSIYYVYSNGLLIRGKVNKSILASNFQKFIQQYIRQHPEISQHYNFKSLCFRPLNELSFLDIKIVFNRVYINTTFGLFVLDENGVFENYYPIQSMYFKPIQRNEIIFQISYGTISKYLFSANNFKVSNYALENPNNPRDVTNVVTYKNVYYYISRYHGLFSSRNFKFKSFVKNKIWQEKELSAISTDGKGLLFISNTFGDVFVISIKKGFKLKSKISREKIIGNSILFLEYYKGFLIVGTEKGVVFVKKDKSIFIDEDSGLIYKNISKSFVEKDTLFLTTNTGFYKMDLTKIIKRKIANPTLTIASISINYKKENSFHNQWFKYDSKEIKLPFDKNNISIKIGFQHFQYPNKLIFQHKIIGLKNNAWSIWSEYNFINLNYLPSGKYIVLVKAKNLINGKETKTRLLNIIIQPPFWQTWSFISLVFLVTLLITFLLIKKRINFIQQQERTKGEVNRRLAETKMEALQSQMNPHFIFNAMNSIQHYIIDEKVDNALQYMSEFSKLIRQTLNNSSKHKIRLEEELAYISSYISLENMRASNRVAYELTLSPAIDTFEIEIPPMLIQPFVENVFIHAFDSSIANPLLLIDLQCVNNDLIITISDNGKGILSTAANFSSSKGIRLTNERIQLFTGTHDKMIQFLSNSPTGTIVCLTIPIR